VIGGTCLTHTNSLHLSRSFAFLFLLSALLRIPENLWQVGLQPVQHRCDLPTVIRGMIHRVPQKNAQRQHSL
jgi:hypothetical protein